MPVLRATAMLLFNFGADSKHVHAEDFDFSPSSPTEHDGFLEHHQLNHKHHHHKHHHHHHHHHHSHQETTLVRWTSNTCMLMLCCLWEALSSDINTKYQGLLWKVFLCTRVLFLLSLLTDFNCCRPKLQPSHITDDVKLEKIREALIELMACLENNRNENSMFGSKPVVLTQWCTTLRDYFSFRRLSNRKLVV